MMGTFSFAAFSSFEGPMFSPARIKEVFEEIEETFEDLKNVGCDILTVGQYIQPSKKHLEVDKYYTLEEFEEIKKLAKKVGFKNFQIGPLVRSSYMAKDLI